MDICFFPKGSLIRGFFCPEMICFEGSVLHSLVRLRGEQLPAGGLGLGRLRPHVVPHVLSCPDMSCNSLGFPLVFL